MSRASLIVDRDELTRPAVTVRGDAYRHLFRARRLAVGERLRLVDGRGVAFDASVEEIGPDRARLRVEGPAPTNEPTWSLEVWAGLPRSRRAAWLVEKVTELGVTAVRWLDSERAGRGSGAAALDRLRRVARSAVEQCHRSRVPEITGPHAWRDLCRRCGEVDVTWVLDPAAPAAPEVGASPHGLAPGSSGILVVGPEGGLTPAERADLDRRDARAVGLGPRVLRIETAAVAGAALLLSSSESAGEVDPIL